MASPARQPNRILTLDRLANLRARHWSHIVIGSGMGGMTCAALLAKAGVKPLLLEQHYQIGGCTHEFEKSDYEFDVGLHYVGQEIWKRDALARKLFDYITDGKVEWASLDQVYDLTTIDGKTFEIPAGRQRLRDHFVSLFPDSAAVIDAYFAMVAQEAAKFSKDMLRKVALSYLPALLVDPVLPADPTFGSATVDEVLDKLGMPHGTLRKLVTYCWGDYGPPPSMASFAEHALVVEHYMEGAAYPVGGPAVIAAAFIDVIESAGGTVVSRCRVESIEASGGRVSGVRVRLGEQTELVRGDHVISAVGAYNTFVRLLSQDVCSNIPELASAREALSTGRVAVSPSHAMTFVALKGTAEELRVPRANMWVQDAKDLSFVFISFPSARDPSYPTRYPGISTCEIVVEANYKDFEPWLERRDKAYATLKEDMAERALGVLYERFPQLRGKVVFVEQSTPLTAEKYLGSKNGCTYGVGCVPSRFRSKWLTPRTALPGLILAGQDVASCSIVGAMMGGAMAAVASSGGALMGLRSIFLGPVWAALSASPTSSSVLPASRL